ncbi:MAG: DUF2752 domain-containing protein [Ruminococcus sp.]|nr:DUF2752 domain-containing protein [Ruminococcus sp.]
MNKFNKTQKIIFALLPLLLIPTVYFAGKFLSNYTYLFPPCMSYTLFHFNCPGCGMTRSVLALLQGDILLSLRQNICVVGGILVCVWLYVEYVFFLFSKKPPFTILKTKFLWALLIFLGIYTALRNIFPVLAPI